ncbi:MAG TPA: efflux RND transporter periplasmic adaptor subunit [Thermoanaerobaculales bacterium]|nr:efflux RND transporter periplasmic adaptor subunit [Thermoanaerobaculales bacterium]HPA81181.1 efflux RND transporter periplasmic adaptor subunit [Thermoanaerobaculales bacterium]HQN96670.1 efflux RND transporter periplasmic adaptor subunit [Thermoanaerobaculales bacterium]HQP43531.1 efflux RND transporter periplasmic adaptor subunit [Thermoanaerobaculales bacterium]
MKKWLIALGALVVLGLVLWASLRDSGPRGAEVEVQPAETRAISSRVKATGEITPDRKVDISAKVVGEIIDLPVVEGQQVQAGQILVQIERDLYESARDQARAALRQAEVSVRRAEVQLEDAERNLRRARKLHAQELVSQERLDSAQLAVDTAQVEIEAQRHAVEQYRSALQRTEDDLARTTIRSPMDGIVIQLDAEKGETVVPGSTNLPGSVIMTVADMSTLLAEVEVSEVDVVDVALGQRAEVTVDALGDEPQQGRVAEIATSGREDASLGTIRFRVKVALDSHHPNLRPAMTAKVAILTATSQQALTVPIQAVVKRALGEDGKELEGSAAKGIEKTDVVYRIDDGKAQPSVVTTGISDELWVEIKEGLGTGDEVVVGPYRTLKNLHSGDAVKIGEAKEESEDEDEGSGEVEVTVD